MTVTPRIRWEPGEDGILFGYVGTLKHWAFAIVPPGSPGEFWMISTPFPLGQPRYVGSEKEARSAAERWLGEFTASLGATFPEPASFTATRDRLATALTRLDVRVLASGPCAGMVDAWSMADSIIEALRETETTALVAAEE